MKPEIDNLISRMELLKKILYIWQPKEEKEFVSLKEALGRVTAEDLYSKNDLPVCRASRMDGIAVCSKDFGKGIPDTSRWQLGKEFVYADTGDDFPDKYDAVIAIEDVKIGEIGIDISPEVVVAKNGMLRGKGETLSKGELLMPSYTRLKPLGLALLAMGGITQVPVLKKPKVAFIPTGDELVSPGISLKRGENVDANSTMVEAELLSLGAEPIIYPIVKDKKQDLKGILSDAVDKSDFVIVNAGSSMGSEDYSVAIISELGEIIQHGIASAPGYPIAFAIVMGKPVINLPGPTIAAFCGMDWAAREMINHALNQKVFCREIIKAEITKSIRKRFDFEMYLRLLLTRDGEKYYANPIPKNASNYTNMVQANGLHIAPIGLNGYEEGDEIQVELLTLRSEIPNHNR